jgi:hypothetical protein
LIFGLFLSVFILGLVLERGETGVGEVVVISIVGTVGAGTIGTDSSSAGSGVEGGVGGGVVVQEKRVSSRKLTR